MSFANLKKNRAAGVSKLVEEANRQSGGGSRNFGDDRLWKPTVDKAGNGYAVIRFLPEAPDNDLPWVRYWDHGFQGPTGQWYIEKSLTSVDKPDPVSEFNSELWNSGIESDKEIARKQKRRLHYVANIYVVSDSANPENEGKVFLYQFGKKIFDKIMDAMKPEFEDETPVNVFDFWKGANFKLKIRQVEGYRNYDKSDFSSPEVLLDDDESLEKVYNKLYDLREFTDPEAYKSYAELKAKLGRVLQLNDPSTSMPDPRSDLDETVSAPKVGREDEPELKAPVEESNEDADLGYFKQLAEED